MTDNAPVRTEIVDRVGWLTLDRPHAMNAITIELARALTGGLDALAAEAKVNVIVIRGAGGNFCAGGDFGQLQALRAEGREAVSELFETFGAACARIASIDVPVVAAVEGCAMAGGFELMLASDIVLVASDTKIADQHANFGQVPGGGSTQRLPRLVGHQRALSLILTGGRLSAADAVDWGIAHRVIPAESFEADIAAFAADLAARSRTAASKIKRLVRDGLALPLDEGLEMERRVVVDHVASDDTAAAAMRSFATRPTPTNQEAP